jgi:hypothetical protein
VPQSWDTKLERAKHHLRDFEGRIPASDERRTYPVSEKLENDGEQDLYVGRLDIPEPSDPLLPIIAGELMFNLRSALDHLAVAMTAEPTPATAFPIFTTDIDEREPGSRQYLHRKARSKWKARTKGFPDGAMPIVEAAQPYMHRREGRDPEHAALALLGSLQNADKHNRLILVVSGLRSPVIWLDNGHGRKQRISTQRVPEHRRMPPGTPVSIRPEPLPPEMHMEAEGILDVMIRDRERGQTPSSADPFYAFPVVFDKMINDLSNLIRDLEQYAVHVSEAQPCRIAASQG